MFFSPYKIPMVKWEEPVSRYSPDELMRRLSKGQYLTPDEKKLAIKYNNERRKKK
jgi:hypothetical protein